MGQSSFKINKKILGKKLHEEWVFLNLENGHYYGLNETGSILWDELKTKGISGDAMGRLQKIFGVDRRILQKDANRFLRDLKKEGLIETASPVSQA